MRPRRRIDLCNFFIALSIDLCNGFISLFSILLRPRPPFIAAMCFVTPPMVVKTSAPFNAAALDVEPVHPVTAPVGSVNPIPEK